jgi:hypothetical protein
MSASANTLYAVYNADGSFMGELRYISDKLVHNASCSLCDITHGLNPRGKARWRTTRSGQPAVIWLHRDEQPPDLADVTKGRLPAVIMCKAGAYFEVLSADDLAACDGNYEAFELLLTQRVEAMSAVK